MLFQIVFFSSVYKKTVRSELKKKNQLKKMIKFTHALGFCKLVCLFCCVYRVSWLCWVMIFHVPCMQAILIPGLEHHINHFDICLWRMLNVCKRLMKQLEKINFRLTKFIIEKWFFLIYYFQFIHTSDSQEDFLKWIENHIKFKETFIPNESQL